MNRCRTHATVGILAALLFVLTAERAAAKTTAYDLTVEDAQVNLSGKKTVDFAMQVNGSIPGPTLVFDEGDEAVIRVHNKMDMETTIHWHGLLLPVAMDGVAPLSQVPIQPGATFEYRFPIRQAGTYWYHSHTMLQEQQGVFGAIVIHPKKERLSYDKEAVVVLSDWADEDPHQILNNLRKDGDYYLWKKDTLTHWQGAIASGHARTYLRNLWARMPAMDVSDVGYDAFLINGKRTSRLIDAKKGERVRLRIINGSASTYFHVNIGQQMFEVVAADGQDVKPVKAGELVIATAETYDVIFMMPEDKSFELRATAQDISGFASTYIGAGPDEHAPDKEPMNPYAHDMMDMENSAAAPADNKGENPHAHMHHAHHGASAGAPLLSYDQLSAVEKTAFDKKLPRYEFRMELDGDMERYIWWINGKLLSEDRTISVKEGDVIRFILVNKSMMNHPMHLHGHFFRTVNAQGDWAPLKHTVNVPAFGEQVIEFRADAPGEWFFHCHNLFHMKNGMSRVVSYQGYQRPPELAAHERRFGLMMDDHWYGRGEADLYTNYAHLGLAASRTWYDVEMEASLSDYEKKTLEGSLIARRWLGKWFNVYLGAEGDDAKSRAIAGIGYVFPLLIEASLHWDNKGLYTLSLEHEAALTKHWRLAGELEVHQGRALGIGKLLYQANWHWNAGIRFGAEGLGAGIGWRF